MASSSKGRASSRKQSSAGKARVISTKRKDALPRTGSVPAGRRKPVVLPPIDALTEPPATVVAAPAPKKKAHSRAQQKEPTASPKKRTRAAGSAFAKLETPATMEVAPAVAEKVEVAAPAPVDEGLPVGVVEVAALNASESEIEQAIATALEPIADAALEPPAIEVAQGVPETVEVAAPAPVTEGFSADVVVEAPALNASAIEAAVVEAVETVAALEPPAIEVAPAAAAVPETVEVAAPAPVAEAVGADVVETPALIAPAMVTAPEPVADLVGAVEPPATAYEEFAVTALEASEVEALAVVETELEVEASAIVEELPFEAVAAPSAAIGPPPIPEETRAPQLFQATAARPAPVPAAPRRERRFLAPAVSRLLSTLVRLTGVSGKK